MTARKPVVGVDLKPARHSRFEDRYMPVPESGCWLWLGTCSSFGHGHIRLGGKLFLAHRAAYEMFVAPIQDDECVLHKCDVPSCVNPSHLFVGSKKDNSRDMVQKNRHKPSGVKGTTHGMSKLTEAQVAQIKQVKRNDPHIPNRIFAAQFGVSTATIDQLLNNKTWKHVA